MEIITPVRHLDVLVYGLRKAPMFYSKRISILTAICCVLTCSYAGGQSSPFRFDAQSKVFRIDTKQTTYAFGVDSRGSLQSIYWGEPIAVADPLATAPNATDWPPFETDADKLSQEFGGWGSGMYAEPALKVTFPDGNRDLQKGRPHLYLRIRNELYVHRAWPCRSWRWHRNTA
jgi:hypothetical protein